MAKKTKTEQQPVRAIPQYMKIDNKPVWDITLDELNKADLQDMVHEAYLDLCNLQTQYNDLMNDLNKAQAEHDKSLEESEDYKHMVDELEKENQRTQAFKELLKSEQKTNKVKINTLQQALEAHKIKLNEKTEQADELEKQLELAKQQTQEPVHNARGAGRKPKLPEWQREQICIEYAAGDTTIRALATKHGTSTGMIQRILNANKAGKELRELLQNWINENLKYIISTEWVAKQSGELGEKLRITDKNGESLIFWISEDKRITFMPDTDVYDMSDVHLVAEYDDNQKCWINHIGK